jgi:hypothetical protein
VPTRGFEPPRPCEHQLLRLACLPFHHVGMHRGQWYCMHRTGSMAPGSLLRQDPNPPTSARHPALPAHNNRPPLHGDRSSSSDSAGLRDTCNPGMAGFPTVTAPVDREQSLVPLQIILTIGPHPMPEIHECQPPVRRRRCTNRRAGREARRAVGVGQGCTVIPGRRQCDAACPIPVYPAQSRQQSSPAGLVRSP